MTKNRGSRPGDGHEHELVPISPLRPRIRKGRGPDANRPPQAFFEILGRWAQHDLGLTRDDIVKSSGLSPQSRNRIANGIGSHRDAAILENFLRDEAAKRSRSVAPVEALHQWINVGFVIAAEHPAMLPMLISDVTEKFRGYGPTTRTRATILDPEPRRQKNKRRR